MNFAIDDIMAELDYNAVGALTNIKRYEWDDNDDLYELIAKSNIQYNANNQITNISHADATDALIAAHSYSFSPDGNITQYTNSIDGTVNYTNDFLGQLIGADYSNLSIHDESYQYDLNGNRELVTNANGDLVVYSTGTNNELTSDGVYTYAYDAEGNRISKTNAVGTERELYVWDYRNRLSSVTKQEYNATTQEWETVQIVEYAYDYNNVLIRKVLDANGDGISDSKTIFLPENYQVAVQLDDADLSDSTDATVSHRYLWTPGQQDKLLADVTPTKTLWTLTDHLGTIRDIIQQTSIGIIQKAHVIYDAYGNVLSCKDANGMDVSNPVLFGFTGKYFDADTQLQNNVNRWYDATTGRWLSTDPIGFEGNDTNLYRYVGNKTIQHIDLWGQQSDITSLDPMLYNSIRIVIDDSINKVLKEIAPNFFDISDREIDQLSYNLSIKAYYSIIDKIISVANEYSIDKYNDSIINKNGIINSLSPEFPATIAISNQYFNGLNYQLLITGAKADLLTKRISDIGIGVNCQLSKSASIKAAITTDFDVNNGRNANSKFQWLFKMKKDDRYEIDFGGSHNLDDGEWGVRLRGIINW